jgi:hypothetical protein
MRMAALSAKLAKAGITIDKSGSTGKVVEVYPAASLAMWNLPNKGYKGAEKRHALATLVQALQTQTSPWLKLTKDQWDLCRKWDDVLDALIASLTAKAHQVQGPPAIEGRSERVVRREGWIVTPRGNLADPPTGG